MKVTVSNVKEEISFVRSELERMDKGDDFVLMRKVLLDYIERDFHGWTHMYGFGPEESDNGGVVAGFLLDVRDILTMRNEEVFNRVDILRLLGRIR